MGQFLKKGKRIIRDDMIIVHSGKKSDACKYAILVSKKKVRTSAERNKVRRIMREVLKEAPLPFSRFVIVCTAKKYTNKSVRQSLQKQ